MIYFAVGAVVLILASLGRFQSAALFPWIFGLTWALAGILSLAWKRRSMSRKHIALTVAGCVLGALSPAGQTIHVRTTRAAWQRDALERFEATGSPPLQFAHVVNDEKQAWPNDPGFTGITLLNFWAAWCSPCLKEMPLLEAFSKTHDPAKARVVGFTRFYEGTDDAAHREELVTIEQLLRRAGVTYPTLVAIGGTTHERYHVHALPTSILIGRDGKVVAYDVGEHGTKRLLKMAHQLAAEVPNH